MNINTKIVVVTKSALELRRGLTTLSGSKPNLKERKDADNAIKLTIRNERKFESSKRPRITQNS